MRRGIIVVSALVVLAVVGVAGAINEKDGSEMNAFDKLGPSIIASDSRDLERAHEDRPVLEGADRSLPLRERGKSVRSRST